MSSPETDPSDKKVKLIVKNRVSASNGEPRMSYKLDDGSTITGSDVIIELPNSEVSEIANNAHAEFVYAASATLSAYIQTGESKLADHYPDPGFARSPYWENSPNGARRQLDKMGDQPVIPSASWLGDMTAVESDPPMLDGFTGKSTKASLMYAPLGAYEHEDGGYGFSGTGNTLITLSTSLSLVDDEAGGSGSAASGGSGGGGGGGDAATDEPTELVKKAVLVFGVPQCYDRKSRWETSIKNYGFSRETMTIHHDPTSDFIYSPLQVVPYEVILTEEHLSMEIDEWKAFVQAELKNYWFNTIDQVTSWIQGGIAFNERMNDQGFSFGTTDRDYDVKWAEGATLVSMPTQILDPRSSATTMVDGTATTGLGRLCVVDQMMGSIVDQTGTNVRNPACKTETSGNKTASGIYGIFDPYFFVAFIEVRDMATTSEPVPDVGQATSLGGDEPVDASSASSTVLAITSNCLSSSGVPVPGLYEVLNKSDVVASDIVVKNDPDPRWLIPVNLLNVSTGEVIESENLYVRSSANEY